MAVWLQNQLSKMASVQALGNSDGAGVPAQWARFEVGDAGLGASYLLLTALILRDKREERQECAQGNSNRDWGDSPIRKWDSRRWFIHMAIVSYLGKGS